MIFFKIAVGLFALLLMIAGLAWIWSPVPFGFVLFLIGLLLLTAVAPAFVRAVRRRWRWFDRQMHKLEKRLPEWMAKALRASDYEHEDEKAAREKREGRSA
ncbi:MAG: hypothetical protein AB7P23_02960 [Amphiplicatus sp.]